MDKGRISLKQLSLMIFMFTLGDSILVLPSGVIFSARQDAWISGLISLVVGSMIMFLYYRVYMIDSNRTFLDNCRNVMGKWLGGTISIIYIFYCYISVALLMRELGAFFLTHFLIRTPMQIIMGLFILTVALAVRIGVVSIARASEIFIPVVLLLLSFLFFMLIYKINLKEFFPIWENGSKSILRGSIPFSAFAYMEIVSIIIFFSLVKDEKITFKKIWIPSLLGGAVLVIATCYCITVLGVDEAANSLYPTLKLGQKIKIGVFFQRLDIIVAILWLLTMFFKTVFYYYFTIQGTGMLFKLKEPNYLIFPLAFLAIPLGLNVAENIVDLNYELVNIWPFFDFTVSIIIPG
ncbi:MAG: endospore germination permease, partial [Bacillota bacterium]|nr:endospore germination permease [Bacillota bacterium]